MFVVTPGPTAHKLKYNDPFSSFNANTNTMINTGTGYKPSRLYPTDPLYSANGVKDKAGYSNSNGQVNAYIVPADMKVFNPQFNADGAGYYNLTDEAGSALYDVSIMATTEAKCDAITNLADRLTCYLTVKSDYENIIKINTDALNSDASNSGSYAILKKFNAIQCSGTDAGCISDRANNIKNTQNEINVRQGRIDDVNRRLAGLKIKIANTQANPVYAQDVKTAANKSMWIYWTVGITATALIAGGLFWFIKRKKTTA